MIICVPGPADSNRYTGAQSRLGARASAGAGARQYMSEDRCARSGASPNILLQTCGVEREGPAISLSLPPSP